MVQFGEGVLELTVIINNDGYEFLECISLNENELKQYSQLAGSYAVVRFDSKYLLCFNTLRKQWEVPAGGRDDSETAKECAIRELFNVVFSRMLAYSQDLSNG